MVVEKRFGNGQQLRLIAFDPDDKLTILVDDLGWQSLSDNPSRWLVLSGNGRSFNVNLV